MTRLLLWGLVGCMAWCGVACAQQPTDQRAQIEQLRKDQEAMRAELSRLQAEVQAMQKLIADLRVSTKTAADSKSPAAATGEVSLAQLDSKLDRILTEIQAVNKARPATTQPSRPPATELIGQVAPAFSLTTTAGYPVSNKEFAVYPATILSFVAPNCGFCKRQAPKVESLRGQYEPAGVRFVNVSQKMGQEFSVPDAQKAYAEMGSNLELAIDTNNQVGLQFRATGYTTLVIVDNKGMIKDVIVGAKPDVDQVVRDQLDRLVGPGASQKPAAAVQPPAANQPAATTPAANQPPASPPAAVPQPAPRTPGTGP
jgi:thiol-disulfide isomerase/thioredoxin